MPRYLITVDKYDDGTVSCWYCPLTTTEANEYDEIMERYQSEGWSTRGDMQAVLDELQEVLHDLKGWA